MDFVLCIFIEMCENTYIRKKCISFWSFSLLINITHKLYKYDSSKIIIRQIDIKNDVLTRVANVEVIIYVICLFYM